MHEQLARSIYYVSIHVMYASVVGAVAWLLTSMLGASASTKYWIWVVTAFNFIVPSGAFIDKFWAAHVMWARPLGLIAGPVWDMTEGRTAVLLGAMWMAGAFSMFMRLMVRLRRERHEAQGPTRGGARVMSANFVADGIPVRFGDAHSSPAVHGVLYPRVLLPLGIDRLLTQREFDAVLIHELAHARRRDNLIRLLYEVSLCVLWFHPFIWLAGTRMALYRELSCDESVIRRAHGEALVSALAKLAVPARAGLVQATASSHLRHRLARLVGPAQTTRRAASLSLSSLFVVVIVAGIFQTIAHTACCFLVKR